MPEEFDRCVKDVKKQMTDKGVKSNEAEDRAYAVCTAQFKKAGKKTTDKMEYLKLSYEVPIKEQGLVDGDFIIKGTAINCTITSNNHKFVSEELSTAAKTLIGVPLLVDHRNEVDAIKGRVLNGEYDTVNEKVNFKAKVIDENMKKMIKDGRLNSVSVGAIVKKLDEDVDNGLLIPRGITFKELSLVAVPADGQATFGIALKEAYNTKIKENNEKSSELKEKEENKTENLSDDGNLKSIERGFNTMSKDNIKEQNKTLVKEKDESKVEESVKEEAKVEEKSETETKENNLSALIEGLTKKMDVLDNLSEKVESLNELSEKVDLLEKKLQEADVDEEKSEEPKAKKESKEDPKEESKEEEKSESEDDKEESKEEEVVSAKAYKIVQGYGSLRGGRFTLIRS